MTLRTIHVKEKELTPSPGPVERTKRRETLSFTMRRNSIFRRKQQRSRLNGHGQYSTGQNSIPEPITKVETWLYTPTKPTSKSDKMEEESQQRKHPEQKKQCAEERQAGKKAKKPLRIPRTTD